MAARSDTTRQCAYAFLFDRDGWTKCCRVQPLVLHLPGSQWMVISGVTSRSSVSPSMQPDGVGYLGDSSSVIIEAGAFLTCRLRIYITSKLQLIVPHRDKMSSYSGDVWAEYATGVRTVKRRIRIR